MPRKPRIEFPGALYHVMARGNNRQVIFNSKTEYEFYLDKLRVTKKRYDFYLYGYCLMPNHLHLLIQTNEVPLSRIMKAVQTAYARYFNRKNSRIGHVFHGRYKAILCDADAYLLELVRYIHLNPVRAGIVKVPHGYMWNSYKDYLGDLSETIVDTELVLARFGNTRSKARHNFHAFILERLHEKEREGFYRIVDRGFLGDEEFIEAVKAKLDGIHGNRLLWHHCDKVSLDHILSLVAGHFRVEESEILSSTQARVVTFARRVFIYIAKERFGYTGVEIARYLEKDDSLISHIVRKVRERYSSDEEFALMIDDLFRQCTE